jgi:hypothetical protein
MAWQPALGRLFDIVPAWIPYDLQTARSGDWVSVKNCTGVTIVFFKGAGTAADDPTLTLNKATAVDGTGSTTAAVIDTIYKKEGTLTSTGTWTAVSQTAAATFIGSATSAESEGLYVIEVNPEALGAYDCLQIACGDVGSNAQLGCALYILHGLKLAETPANLTNSLTD